MSGLSGAAAEGTAVSSRGTSCFQGGHRAPRPPGMSCFITDASRGLQAWAAMLSPGAPWTPALKG